jgi:hypothetical protein
MIESTPAQRQRQPQLKYNQGQHEFTFPIVCIDMCWLFCLKFRFFLKNKEPEFDPLELKFISQTKRPSSRAGQFSIIFLQGVTQPLYGAN